LPEEKEYGPYLNKKYGITLHERDRLQVMTLFGKKAAEYMPEKKLRFKILKNIEDIDESQEPLHALRTIVRFTMQ